MVAGGCVDVVVCVEDTAQGGTAINSIKNDYLLAALEQLSGGPPSDVNFSYIEMSSTYTLIPFKASDCLPEPSARIHGPFTSTKRFFNAFERLEFIGGCGETHTSGQEALASALKVFDDLKRRRKDDFLSSRCIIYISNSPIYDMPVLQCTSLAGKTIDELCSNISERNVAFSVFAPRKIPFLFKLFEKTGGDLSLAKEKNYAKDLRHMVLLRGFVLEERAVTPKPPPSTSPSILQGGVSYPFNLQQQGLQNQQPQFLNQAQGGILGAGLGNQGILQSALQNPQPQENNQTLKGLLGKKPIPINQGPGWNFQIRGQMPSVATLPNQMQPGINQGFPGGQQQQQQQQQQVMGMVHQGNQGTMGPMHGNQSGLGVVMGNQSGMVVNPGGMIGGMPGGQVGMSTVQGPQSGMVGVQGPQAGMSGVQLSQGGMTGVQGQQVGMGGVIGGSLMGQGGMMGNQQRTAQPREREIIWSGELEWQEKVKDGPADQKISHSVACTVSTSKDNGQAEVRPENWPSKLIMQLIPKTLVQTIGGQYFKQSKSVLFHPTECDSLEALTKVMGSGFAGCVHFTGSCEIKVLILLYSSEKKAYLGFIPNDQASFVDRIRTVIQQQKAGQMRQGMPQQPMMNQQANMPMQNNIIQQQGMMNPGMMPQGSSMNTGGGMMNNQGQQMVMLAGGNMVRMPQEAQYMRMQAQPQRMMHNPGLRQILQQPGNMMTGMQGQVMQNQGMQGQVMQNQGMQGMQGGMQGQVGMQGQGVMQGQGGMMMQQRMMQQQQQQQQPDPLRDLLN